MKKHKRYCRNILPYLLVVIMVSCAVIWAKSNWGEIKSVITLNPLFIMALLPLMLSTLLIVGFITKIIASYLGLPLRFSQWSSLAFASTLANYILPMRAGIALRASYLKRCHNFPFSKFAGATTFIYVITLLSNSAIGVIVLLWLWVSEGITSWPLLGVFLFILIFGAGLLIFSPKAKAVEHPSKIRDFINKVHLGWSTLRTSPCIIIKSSALLIANTLISAIRLYVAYKALGHGISMAGCILVGTFANISMFISITPASLGIKEAAILFAGSVIGVAPEISLLAGGIDRAVSMLIVAILGPVGMVKVSHESTKLNNVAVD